MRPAFISSSLPRFFPVAALLATGWLSGCAVNGFNNPSATATGINLIGSVYGGQQPVAGATLQLYAVGTTALGAASTALIASTVTSNSTGGFNITGTYSCTGATQVYLVASGGNAGSGVNSYSVMAAALGNCSTLLANASTTFININELTTVAAAYALAPFELSAYTSIGANTSALPGSVGLPNAFNAASALVDPSTGLEPATPPVGITVPTAKLNTLADILASCVNSAGGASAACTQIKSVTGATNVFDAAFYIAKNPADTGVLGLYTLAAGSPPFLPTSTAAPKDFTLSLRYAGTTATPLGTPYGIAIDALGNAFVTNQTGNTVTALSPVGPGFVTGSTSTGLSSPMGISIDETNGYFWIANPGLHNVESYASLASVSNNVQNFGNVTGTAVTGFGSAANPAVVANDLNGNAYTVSPTETKVYSIGGTSRAVTNSLTNASFTGVGALAFSASTSLAVGNSSGQACTMTTALTSTSCVTQGSATSISALAYNPFLTSGGYAGVGNGTSTTAALYGQTLNATSTFLDTASTSTPTAIAFGDGGRAFIAYNGALYVFNGSTSISPSTGFSTLSTPQGVAVDPSGNVWTTNAGNNSVSIFIGLAAPTLTPIAANLH